LGWGKSRGLMKAWFYHNSHLLRYTEEALAESYASGSLRWGLRYPLLGTYAIKASRLVLEGVGVGGAYGGLVYGGYEIGRGLERH
jgi:hypothetical protein